METKAATDSDVEKLREWVDDLRVKQPLEAPKAPTAVDPAPQVNVLKAPSEISEGARRVQKIVEAMDLRRQERARLVAEGNSKKLLYQDNTDQERKSGDEQIAAWQQEFDEKVADLRDHLADIAHGRQWELDQIAASIAKIDTALSNFKTQMNAELAKLDPEA